MPQPESRQASLVQSSRATVLELWASPDLKSAVNRQPGYRRETRRAFRDRLAEIAFAQDLPTQAASAQASTARAAPARAAPP